MPSWGVREGGGRGWRVWNLSNFELQNMWHLDQVTGGTKYDKSENLTKLTGGECQPGGHFVA